MSTLLSAAISTLGFMEIFSRGSLPTIKVGAYVINLNDKQSKRTRWLSLFIDRNTVVYWNFFGAEYIPQEVLNQR